MSLKVKLFSQLFPITSYSRAKVYYTSRLSLVGKTRCSDKPWYLLLPRQADCCCPLADVTCKCVASVTHSQGCSSRT